MLKKDFGTNIKRLRERAKLNQSELATELEKLSGSSYTRSNISKWEVGDAIPPLTLLPALSSILNASILDFFHSETSKKNEQPRGNDIPDEIANLRSDFNDNPEVAFQALMKLVDELYMKLKTCQDDNESLKERLEVISRVSTKGI